MLELRKPILLLFVLVISGLITACTQQTNNEIVQPIQGSSVKQSTRPQKEIPKETLWVCQLTANQVAVLDLASREVIKEIPVGAKPIALLKSPDDRYIYVANSGSGDVYSINASTGEIEAKIAMGNQPVAMAINNAGDLLYVLDYYLNRVSVIDLKLRSMIGFYELNTYGFDERIEPPDCCSDIFGEPLGAGRKPSAIVLNEAAGEIYVGNMGTWDVAVIDIKEEKEVKAFNATFGINDMFLAGPKNKVYISAAGNEAEINDAILAIDMKGGGNIDRIMVGGKPVSMALSPDHEILYVVTQNDTKLTSINVEDDKIIGQCILGGQPGDLVLSEDGSKAFVADLLEGTVIIVDTDTYKVLDKIEVGVTPKSLVYIN